MEIKINPEINNLANEILAKEQAKKDELKATEKYIEKCIKVKICPICGSELKTRPVSKEEKRRYSYDYYYDTLFCEKDDFIKINGDYCNDYD